MPISITLTEGVIPADKIGAAVEMITRSFLERHSLGGNEVMALNVTTHVFILPKGHTFAGGEPVDGAWIETKTPSFALADHEIQSAFFSDATQILHDSSGGALGKDHIWSNGVHAVDGTWNIGGKALTNAEIVAALAAA